MKLRNRIISSLTATTLLATVFSGTAFAATDAYANGDYVATSRMYKDSSGTINLDAKSSCEAFFSNEAYVTLTDDATTIVWYVESATDYGMNTIDNFTVTYDGNTYDAVIDFDNDVIKEINSEDHNANKVTLTLPAAAIDTVVNEGLLASSYVPAMAGYANGAYATPSYWVKLSDVQKAPTESSTQSSTVTAEVEKNTSSYIVTVPSQVALGTLSKTEDTTVAFDVIVEAEYFEDESIEVAAKENGEIVSEKDDSIEFTNDFGTQSATESTTLTGNINVKAADVAAAKGGNYTGTTTFV
ncbi:MAG: hypothetical protein IJ675_06465, partial [Pseudobutyrivibrio sp.]|nr:hypothetical protein [Pseudobutyrivibrio sp.]